MLLEVYLNLTRNLLDFEASPCALWVLPRIGKRGGVQKSMGHKVPWKIVMLICLNSCRKKHVYLPVTSRPPNLTACSLNFYLLLASRPMKWRTLSQRPKGIAAQLPDHLLHTRNGETLQDIEYLVYRGSHPLVSQPLSGPVLRPQGYLSNMPI